MQFSRGLYPNSMRVSNSHIQIVSMAFCSRFYFACISPMYDLCLSS